jgi:lambda family phage portal protein
MTALTARTAGIIAADRAALARTALESARPPAVVKESLTTEPRVRMYGGAMVNRLTADWQALGTSADSEILTSLRLLRARSRQMVRDNPYAKRTIKYLVDNVIGRGIGFQAQVSTASKTPIQGINDRVEEAWAEWSRAKTAHTAGLLHFSDIERIAFGQIVEAGEVLIRKVRSPFGGGSIPLALEVIESDRLMDQWQTARAPNGNMIRMGVEIDEWGRPVAYWLWPTHPGDYQFRTFVPSKFVRVPAEDMIHLYILERWPQTRGVPWLHAALTRLKNIDGTEEGEIVAARASANIVGFITTPDHAAPGDDTESPQRLVDTAPGQFQTLLPGESFQGFNPSRPNASLVPFLNYMVRTYAVAVSCSYSGLSGDYSMHNYSSLRMEGLNERDAFRILQAWFVRHFRAELHPEWCDAAALAGAIPASDYHTRPKKYQSARFRPRGWTWIDPKEVQHLISAVRAGFMTVGDVVADSGNGADVEDVFKARRRELDLAEALDLVLDTDPEAVNDKGTVQPSEPPDHDPESPAEEAEEPKETEAETEAPKEDAAA